MILNYTHHNVTIIDGDKRTVLPSDGAARLSEIPEVAPPIDDIPCIRKTFGGVVGLPRPRRGVYYVVSGYVFENCDRPDLLSPDTGPESVVRSDHGHILGVRRLRRK